LVSAVVKLGRGKNREVARWTEDGRRLPYTIALFNFILRKRTIWVHNDCPIETLFEDKRKNLQGFVSKIERHTQRGNIPRKTLKNYLNL